MQTALTHDYEIPTWNRNIPALTIPSGEMLRCTTKEINEAIQMYCHTMQTECMFQINVEIMEILQKFAKSCRNASFVFGIEEQNGNRWPELLFHRHAAPPFRAGSIDQSLMSEDGNEYTLYELET